MRHNRKWVRQWRVKLMELEDTIDYDKPGDLGEVTGLAQAMLETSILDMLIRLDPETIADLMQATLRDIVTSQDNPRHWRNRETDEIRKMWHKRELLNFRRRRPHDRLD